MTGLGEIKISKKAFEEPVLEENQFAERERDDLDYETDGDFEWFNLEEPEMLKRYEYIDGDDEKSTSEILHLTRFEENSIVMSLENGSKVQLSKDIIQKMNDMVTKKVEKCPLSQKEKFYQHFETRD